ncbi:MAG: hypothetical protein KA052_00065 [Candidatus Pacebacteria bacterium]|nr:hypothetical protein [Candidatus Paceibacterota bacterium]
MDSSNFKEKIQSKKFHRILACVLIGFITICVFTLGVQVGIMKAGFNYQSGDNYYRTFGPKGPHHMATVSPNMSEVHGVSGEIVSIKLPFIIVADDDLTEKTVVISEKTILRKLRNTITSSDLAVNDYIVIIGEPGENSVNIEAKFIRVLPPPPLLEEEVE